MASVSTSHLILFIASMVIAAGVAGTFTNSIADVSAAIDDRTLDASREVRTDVEIISDAGSPVYNTSGENNITLLVKNTGSRQLRASADALDVLLDGAYRTNVTVTVVDGVAWTEGGVVRVEISAPSLTSGDHRVKLIVEGDEEVFEFRT